MVTLLPVFMLLFCLNLFDWAVALNERSQFRFYFPTSTPSYGLMEGHYVNALELRLSVVKTKAIVFFGLMTPGLLQVLSQ